MTADSRTKVLLLPGWYPSKDDPLSGTFVIKHATAAARYSEVVVVRMGSPPEGYCSNYRTIWVEIPQWIRIRIIKYIVGLIGMVRAIMALARTGWYPDVIHVHVCLSTAGICGLLVSRLLRRPLVVSEHWTGYIRQLPPRMALFVRLLAVPIFNQADLVCPVSSHLKEALRGWGVTSRIEVIPNVVDISREDDKKIPIVVKSFMESREHKHMVLIGANLRIKGLDYVIEALSRVRSVRSDIRLTVVGGVDQSERLKYQQRVQQLGLEDCVLFTGPLSPSSVAEVIRLCDFGVQPSIRETFGIAVLEYLAAGKPVITSNIEPIKSLVPQAYCTMVSPGDVEALRDAMIYFLEHCHQFPSEEMISYIERNFGLDAVAVKLAMIYQRLRDEWQP